tara:strand:- start:63 stop:701 length:639 start_codon:yes stop_codon:yes gene_type:complete
MTEIKIPEIYIPHIAIPKVYIPQVSLPPADRAPEVQTIGCKYFHRDVKNTGNRNLLIDDPNGVVSNCPYPSFIPMNYQPDQLIIVEEAAVINDEPTKLPEGKPPQAEIPKEDKKEDVFLECPGKNDQRVGDFRNEKRLERVVGHERSEDGTICTTIYEDVPFKDQYIPEVSTIVSTAVIGLVAASTPLLLNAVKPLVKQIVKKLTKKKKDVK